MTNDVFAEKMKAIDTERDEVWNKLAELNERTQELFVERNALVERYLLLTKDLPFDEVVLNVARVSKILAIKHVRNHTDMDLRASKDFVDGLLRIHGKA